jgi:hypothetical protein
MDGLKELISERKYILSKVAEEGRIKVFSRMIEKFMHSFPQILFFSLPLIALVLQLLYIRRRKQFFYVNHGIFLIHIYIYSFINLIVYFSIGKLGSVLGWRLGGLDTICIGRYMPYGMYIKQCVIFMGSDVLKQLLSFCC